MLLHTVVLSLCVGASADTTTAASAFAGLHVPRCPADYPDITKGVAYWWTCCSECPGLAYCTITCCCACQRASLSDTGNCLVGHPTDLQGSGADETAALAVRTAGGTAALLPEGYSSGTTATAGGTGSAAGSGTSSGSGGASGTSSGTGATSGSGASGSGASGGGGTGTSGSGSTSGSSGSTSGAAVGGSSGTSSGTTGESGGTSGTSGGSSGTGGATGVSGGTSGLGVVTSSVGAGTSGGATGVSSGGGGLSGGVTETETVTFYGTLQMLLTSATETQVGSATEAALAEYLKIDGSSVSVQARASRRLGLVSRRLATNWLLTYRAVVRVADADTAETALKALTRNPWPLSEKIKSKLLQFGAPAAASQTLQLAIPEDPRKVMPQSYYSSPPSPPAPTNAPGSSSPMSATNQPEASSNDDWAVFVAIGVGVLMCLLATGIACLFLVRRAQTQVVSIMSRKSDKKEYVLENGVLTQLSDRKGPPISSGGPENPTIAMLNMATASQATAGQQGPIQSNWAPPSSSRGASPAQSRRQSPAGSRNASPQCSPRGAHDQAPETTLRIPLSSSRTPSKDSRRNPVPGLSLPSGRSASKDPQHSARRDANLSLPQAASPRPTSAGFGRSASKDPQHSARRDAHLSFPLAASPRPTSAGSHARLGIAAPSPRGNASLSLPGARSPRGGGSPSQPAAHSPRGGASPPLPSARGRSPAPPPNELK
eukprot:TRINITY_DN9231_c0_g1_i2.p1 TRINITY_DN9231_c0_g1~~TRINITY_DN9231_c0_g1_i2.p1  ORF type:complete len:715 (+),score=61.45 TRINITY_DN9231_c0_g1_i2:33-2177(+)